MLTLRLMLMLMLMLRLRLKLMLRLKLRLKLRLRLRLFLILCVRLIVLFGLFLVTPRVLWFHARTITCLFLPKLSLCTSLLGELYSGLSLLCTLFKFSKLSLLFGTWSVLCKLFGT